MIKINSNILNLFYIGNYHCVDNDNKTLFRLFEVPKEKMDLINNADSAVQSYWTHIHNDQIHAPPNLKGLIINLQVYYQKSINVVNFVIYV